MGKLPLTTITVMLVGLCYIKGLYINKIDRQPRKKMVLVLVVEGPHTLQGLCSSGRGSCVSFSDQGGKAGSATSVAYSGRVPNMKPYIEFLGTLQNSGFWLVKVRLQVAVVIDVLSGG